MRMKDDVGRTTHAIARELLSQDGYRHAATGLVYEDDWLADADAIGDYLQRCREGKTDETPNQYLQRIQSDE